MSVSRENQGQTSFGISSFWKQQKSIGGVNPWKLVSILSMSYQYVCGNTIEDCIPNLILAEEVDS